MSLITTELDEHLRERCELKSRWEVTLSDGTKVYQDDERQGRPSWLNLKEYLTLHPTLAIAKMFMGFRDNVIILPDNAEGYFFTYGLLASWGEWEKHRFLVGTLKDKIVTINSYELPEVGHLGEETRTLEECGEGLIVNSPLAIKKNWW